MHRVAEKQVAEITECRWKHLRGAQADAVYRASCGSPRCPGHLGDLAHLCIGRWDERICSRLRERHPWNLPVYWRLSASPVPGPDVAIYHGHPDSGYRLAFGGKRAKNGKRIGRRPFFMIDPFEGAPEPRVAESAGHRATGQAIRPPARIWCPSCGTLNQIDWPDALGVVDLVGTFLNREAS
jgi:hypothetical protein